MVFLGFSPYFIFSSFFITLLLDRGAFVTGNKELPTASPWYPSGPSAIASKADPDALKKVLPLVTFDCRGKTGYFPDSKFNCEVFHYCQPDGARNTFHCPAHQLFNQLSMVCEEKTVHNSRLCKEGSINPSKLQRFSSNKKHDVSQKTSPILKPSLNSSSAKESPRTMMTLEDLLGYMNSGPVGKEANPTFISRFHKAEEVEPIKHIPDSAIATPVSGAKSAKEKSPTMSSDTRLTAEGSEESLRITRVSAKPGTNSKKKSEDDEAISTEYDAIEGRKFRKHKRIGRIIDIQGDQKTNDDNKPHTQLSSRSATDSPLAEDSTVPTADDEEARNGSSHSLFSTDRNRARDFRKRKRFPGRKRKVLTPGSTNDTDTGSEFVVPTTTASFQSSRQDLDALRNNAYRRRKSQRTRTRDDMLKSLQSSPKTEKVEPYSLPPLPTPGDDKMEVTTESMHREEKKRDPLQEGRSKNPWYKPTQAPAEDGGHLKFGEKVPDLDQHYYQTDAKMVEGPAAPDYYGTKDLPSTSEELLGGDYKEKVMLHSKNPADERPNPKSKLKKLETFSQEEAFKYGSHPEKHHLSPSSQNFFPPPRAEAREHHSTPPQQMIRESSAEKHKTEHSSSKATTEDPFRVTHPYLGKYQTGVQQLKDLEEERWKINSEKAKANEKIAVGSTFFFQNTQNSESSEPTKKLRLQSPSPTETPVLNVHKEKDMSKHIEAHQHLSKIMNDFFAMSSSNTPGHSHVNLNKEDDIIIPDYRIPDEDIYAGSESVNEDVEEIPPELLEVVDLLTGHVNNEERDMKPQASHEIIRINGPITDSHLEKIFLDDKFDEEFDQRSSAEGSYKKIIVVPQPDDREEDIKEMEDEAEYTSLKLEPFLKQLSNDKSVTVIPLKTESILQRQPAVLSAKQIPVRVIYRDQVTDTEQPKQSNRKSNIKYVQSHLPLSRLQQNSLGRRPASRPITHMYSTHSRPSVVFHPSTLFPPHPPPLQKKQLPFRVGYPFVSNTRSFVQNSRHLPRRRRKRSIINRLRRQIRQNQHFLPFSSPVFSAFNPKFVPTFSPFKSLFGPASLHTSGSHLTPFTYPSFPLAKPSQNRPNIFQPSHPRPPPVRHVTQSGHQTVIVEEVPVPIHVEVPSPNLIRPASPGAQSAKLHPRYPINQLRTPSPPALQTPPLIQRPQNRFPPPPNNYRPLGMPSNARPPAINFQPGNPFSQHLPPSITSQGQLYALGVTNKPLLPPNPRPPRPPGLNSPRNPPRPYNPFDIQANGYPNFPYFQGAFTTPISNEPVAGRLMYSGYKPPKSTLGTKPPKPSHPSTKERKPSESKSNRSRSKPTQDYFEAPARPMRESHVSYTEEVINRGHSRPKPNYTADYSTGHADITSPRQSLSKGPTSDEMVPRKRKPGRRRRPRPHSTTTQTTSILNDISPTPPPPEQIPPPPADYTSKPHHNAINSLPSFNEGTQTHEASNNFPPAGYYGKDQLVQFFDSSSKAYQKSTSPKPYHKDLGESTSSAELDESIMSMSGEDRNEPAFGTRLRSKPQGQSRNRQSKNRQPARSQTQNTEVRTRPSSRPDETVEQRKREFTQTKPNEGSKMQIRNENTPPRRRRPVPPRPRSRSPPMHTTPTQPKMHNFNYNENMANFYSVPRGLQNLVAPVDHPQKNFGGSRDMFGLPHPVIDQNIYSLRPQGAPVDFNSNFFSVPAHVSQQQQSPLHKMNIKPIPESERDFFTAPDAGATTIPEASTPERQEIEQKVSPHKSGGETNEQRDTPVKRLRKPKRKNRYNPHSNEQKDSAEVNSAKPYTEQTTARESIAIRYKEKPTTIAITTPEPRSTSTSTFHSQNDIKESPVVYKQRNPLLPKAVPDLSKSLLNGKLDIQKLNATISTSVSVSGAAPQISNTSSEEKENKRVFSSQNGGLAVVRKGPKRKRARQRVSTTTGVPYVNSNDASTDAKYEIAASVLDIIKATTETERQTSGYYDPPKNEKLSSSRVSNTWVEKPSNKRQS